MTEKERKSDHARGGIPVQCTVEVPIQRSEMQGDGEFETEVVDDRQREDGGGGKL